MPATSTTPTNLRRVWRLLWAELGLAPAAIIENAALAVAEVARLRLSTTSDRACLVLAGPGSTGAVALASARRLLGWGCEPVVLLGAERSALEPTAAEQLALADTVGTQIFEPGALIPRARCLIDGLVGLESSGPLRGSLADLASMVSRLDAPIIAIDVPSGLDPASGKADQPVIRAEVTVALGYPTDGVRKPFAANLVGQLLIADIGIPAAVWQKRGLAPPNFSGGLVTRVGRD